MKTSSLFLSVMMTFISNITLAGSTGGGFPGLQLENLALSETMMSAVDMQEVIAGSGAGGGGAVKLEAMGGSTGGVGVMIEVQSSDFTIVTTDAAQGNELVYRDTTVRAAAMDTQAKVLIMHPVEDPSITIIVKDAGSK